MKRLLENKINHSGTMTSTDVAATSINLTIRDLRQKGSKFTLPNDNTTILPIGWSGTSVELVAYMMMKRRYKQAVNCKIMPQLGAQSLPDYGDQINISDATIPFQPNDAYKFLFNEDRRVNYDKIIYDALVEVLKGSGVDFPIPFDKKINQKQLWDIFFSRVWKLGDAKHKIVLVLCKDDPDKKIYEKIEANLRKFAVGNVDLVFMPIEDYIDGTKNGYLGVWNQICEKLDNLKDIKPFYIGCSCS